MVPNRPFYSFPKRHHWSKMFLRFPGSWCICGRDLTKIHGLELFRKHQGVSFCEKICKNWLDTFDSSSEPNNWSLFFAAPKAGVCVLQAISTPFPDGSTVHRAVVRSPS